MPERPDTGSNGLRAAILSGSFVLLGALIAAGAGTVGPVLLQERENNREDTREDLQTRGAARLLRVELGEAASQQAILFNDRRLRKFDPAYAVDVAPEDLRLIASRLEPEEWRLVEASIVNTEGLSTFVNTLVERDDRTKLTLGEACYAQQDFESVQKAMDALAPLAEVEPEAIDELPSCAPQPRNVVP